MKKWYISAIREDIQMFLLNMSFISQVKWTIFIFHEIIVHFWSEIKDTFNKNILIFFLLFTKYHL